MFDINRYQVEVVSLIKRFRGLFLVGGVTSLEKAIHLVTFFALSPWVSPEEYGLFALAWVVIAVVDGFFDFGASFGFLSDKGGGEESKQILNAASLIFSSSWASVCILSAFIVSCFDDRSIDELLYILSLIVLLRGVSYPCCLTFIRNQDYRLLTLNGIIPPILGGITGIVLAVYGWGVWALVGRYLADAVVRCVLVWVYSPYSHKLLVDIHRTYIWIAKGWKLAVSNNLGWLVVLQVEQVIIGSVMGPAMLGIYNFAKKPVDIAGQIFGPVSNKYFLPTYISRPHSVASVMKMGITLSVITAIACIPGCWLAMTLVFSYWPAQWAPAAELMPLVFLLLPILIFEVPLKSFLAAQGNSGVILKLTILSSIMSMFVVVFCAFTASEIVLIVYGAILVSLLRLVIFILFVVRTERGGILAWLT